MLTFDNVRFQYDCEDFSIIDHLSFTVQDGEFVSVIGPSGCGKSTIFRLVNKLLPPAEGNILVNENMETTIPGLYAAGDCTGGLLQVAKAVYDGAQAGISANQYVRSKSTVTK